MMHSIKCQSPLKHDLKLGVNKPSSDKNSEKGGSLSNLIDKCTNLSSPLQTNSSKLTKRASNFKSKLTFKVSSQTKLKKSFKRKEESPSTLGNKKLKSDYEMNHKANKLQSKSQSEFKSVYYKDSASYVCKFCCRRFSSVEQLKEHTLIHGNKSSYICHICNHEAACFSALMTHVVKHSRKSDVSETVNNDINLSTSEKVVSSFQCNQCKLSFTTSQKLSNHNCPSVSFEKSEYMCAYCGKMSTSVEEYRFHVQSHSITPFMCIHCKLKLPTKKHLDRHNEICKKRPKLKFKCEKCSFACKGKRELNQHIKKCELNIESSIFGCPMCKSSFSVKSDLDDHILNCRISLSSQKEYSDIQKEKRIKKVSYICDLCGKTFATKLGHEKHKEQCVNSEKLVTTKKSNVTLRICPTCGIQIDSLSLEEHIESCFSSLHSNVNLKSPSKHSDGEMSPNKYSGGEMSPSKNSGGEESPNTRRSARLVGRKIVFSSEEDVKVKETYKPKHIKKFKLVSKFRSRKGRQSKLGKENFMCLECNLTFCSKSTLLRHKRMHSGNPWFSCKYCGKYFFRKDVFNRHEMNVHNKSNKNVFCCYYCKLFFNAAVLLKEHVATAHKENSLQSKSGDTLNLDEIDPQIQVKLEPDSHNLRSDEVDHVKSADGQCSSELSCPKMINFPSYSKKCGICSQIFVTIAEIEKHLLTHPVPNINDYEAPNEDTLRSIKNNVKVVSDELATDKVIDKCDIIADDANSLLKENVASFAEPCSNDISIDETLEISSNNVVKEKYSCKLCFKTFNDKTAFSKHEAEQHVIVDWYQCLVCDVCGSKRDMVEHMFTHMYQVGTFVVANNDFNNVFSCLQQSKIDVLNHKKQASASVGDLSDNKCEEIELEDDGIELPKLTYHGNPNLEIEKCSMIESQSDAINEQIINLKANQESVKEISFIDTSTVECLKETECMDSEYHDNDSLSKNNLVQNIQITPIISTLNSNSDENPNDKDPFQELRRILKADKIPLKEISMSSDVSSKSDLYNKASNEENSSDAQNYSQLRYLLEKNDKNRTLDKIASADQYVECAKESTENSDAITSMRNLIQDLKSLNKLVSENVSNPDVSEEENLNEADKVHIPKLNETHSKTIKNADDTNKLSIKNLNETDTFNVKKLNEGIESQVKILNETYEKRNEQDKMMKDINETRKFKFRNNNELDKNIFMHINETNKFSSKSSNETIRYKLKNNKESEEMIFKNRNEADNLSFKSNNETDRLSFKKKTEEDKGSQSNLNQVYNTCLKFDVNQSRGEFSERSSPGLFQQNSSEFQKMDKLNSLFQPTNPPSTILDFSDLLKISDSTSLNENSIFGISSQNSVLCDTSSTFAYSSANNFSHKSPVNLTYSSGTFFSKEEFICNKCSTKCKSYNDFVKHQCVKPVSSFEQTSPATPEIKTLPFDFSRTTLENSNDLVKTRQNVSESSKHRSTSIFMCCVCSKIVKTSSVLEQHYRVEHSGYSNNSFPNNKCIQCHQILYGIADFMKHSLNCLKSNNSVHLNEISKNRGLLQSLLLKPDSQAQGACLANSNVSQDNDMAKFTYENILNLSQNSFSS